MRSFFIPIFQIIKKHLLFIFQWFKLNLVLPKTETSNQCGFSFVQKCQSGLTLKLKSISGNPQSAHRTFDHSFLNAKLIPSLNQIKNPILSLQKCQSGRMCSSRKRVCLRGHRRFESAFLRHAWIQANKLKS